jgi:ABC-type uncharacterized transport system permease subunit
MRAGAGPMQVIAKTPRELVDVLQGVILIVLVALPVIARAVGGRGTKVVPAEAQTVTQSYAGGGTGASAPGSGTAESVVAG